MIRTRRHFDVPMTAIGDKCFRPSPRLTSSFLIPRKPHIIPIARSLRRTPRVRLARAPLSCKSNLRSSAKNHRPDSRWTEINKAAGRCSVLLTGPQRGLISLPQDLAVDLCFCPAPTPHSTVWLGCETLPRSLNVLTPSAKGSVCASSFLRDSLRSL